MAPQTLHLQAVAGRAAASRRPRAQAVIYTGPCICLSRAERNRGETALPLHLAARLQCRPTWQKKNQNNITGPTRTEIIQKAAAGGDKTPVVRSAHVHARCLGKLSWKIARERSCQGVCAYMRVCVFRGAWSLPMAETYKRGFHPCLSLIREGSLIPSHPMLWCICIRCHGVMEVFFLFFFFLRFALKISKTCSLMCIQPLARSSLIYCVSRVSSFFPPSLPVFGLCAFRRFLREERFKHCEDSRLSMIVILHTWDFPNGDICNGTLVSRSPYSHLTCSANILTLATFKPALCNLCCV